VLLLTLLLFGKETFSLLGSPLISFVLGLGLLILPGTFLMILQGSLNALVWISVLSQVSLVCLCLWRLERASQMPNRLSDGSHVSGAVSSPAVFALHLSPLAPSQLAAIDDAT